MLLRKAYLSFHRKANSYTQQFGLTADQYVVLSTLRAEDGITQIELVDRTASDPNTMGALLRVLERRELIRRTPHPEDRRARCVLLTVAGRQLQNKSCEALEAFMQQLLACLPSPVHDGEVEAALSKIHLAFSSRVRDSDHLDPPSIC